jgi:hypothetical protein
MKGAAEMNEVLSLEGPLQIRNGHLVLLIPLDAGGYEILECSKGISQVDGEYLKIVIPEWLAGLLRVEVGDRVIVENPNGKFAIRAVHPRPIQ